VSAAVVGAAVGAAGGGVASDRLGRRPVLLAADALFAAGAALMAAAPNVATLVAGAPRPRLPEPVLAAPPAAPAAVRARPLTADGARRAMHAAALHRHDQSRCLPDVLALPGLDLMGGTTATRRVHKPHMTAQVPGWHAAGHTGTHTAQRARAPLRRPPAPSPPPGSGAHRLTCAPRDGGQGAPPRAWASAWRRSSCPCTSPRRARGAGAPRWSPPTR